MKTILSRPTGSMVLTMEMFSTVRKATWSSRDEVRLAPSWDRKENQDRPKVRRFAASVAMQSICGNSSVQSEPASKPRQMPKRPITVVPSCTWGTLPLRPRDVLTLIPRTRPSSIVTLPTNC